MPGVVDTCNEALAEIGAGSIVALDEGSPEAKACNRFYASVVADLLDLHEWGFTNRRRVLAERVNDRPGEWGYAYAVPNGAVSLRSILPSLDAASPWYWPGAPLYGSYAPLAFIEEAGTIYANVSPAVLEYATDQIEPGDMPALFRRAVVYELASRIAMPVLRDRRIKGDVLQLAIAARTEAMVDDENRYPRRQRAYVSDAELARNGWPVGYLPA